MSNQNKPYDELQSIALQPISRWWSTFDYVFGFQLKIVQDYWGIGSDRSH